MYLEMMSVELLCRAPLWLGKFVVRHIIRRAHTRNNRVKPPKKWEPAALLLYAERLEEGRIKLNLDKGKGYVESIAEGIIRIYTSKENEKEIYSEAIIYDDNPPKLKLSKGKKLVITQQCSDSIKLMLFPYKEIFDVIGPNTTKLCSNEYFRTSKEGWYSYRGLSGTENEHYFGFGETTRPLDKRNSTISFWNTDSFAYSIKETHLYQSLPIKIAVRENGYCYAIVYDNPHKSQVTIKNAGKQYLTTYFVEGGGINYYIVLGPSIQKLFKRLTKLLGNAPLPPLSALGYHQSRWSYYTEEEVRTLAKEFRKRKIPCDWIHLDIDYMDAYRIFTFDKTRFPNPKKLSEDLKKEGFNLVAITDPGVKVDMSYSICKEGIDHDHFCKNADGLLYKGKVWPGECYFPDFSQVKTRKWFGEKFRVLIENGIKGFWIDMNEPSVFSSRGTIEPEIVHPHDGKQLTHAEVHNQYGFLMAKATYEGIKSIVPNERVFVLTRAAYLGIQRYAGSWTGDNIAEWKHLALSLTMLMNMSVSGQVMIGPDIGGFLGKPTAELLIRWYQAGLGYPFYRNHTINKLCSQEPWMYGSETEKIIKKTIRLRYKLLIYLYNAIRNQCLTGIPAFRPLWVDFPTDKKIYDEKWLETEYLIGDAVLVAPILKNRQRKRQVYLPKGSNWYDFKGNYYEGGKIYEISVPLDYVPIFIRENYIIPIINNPIQHTGEIFESEIDLLIAPKNSQATGEIYLDDGKTLDYKKGEYEILYLNAKKESDGNWYVYIRREGKKKQYINIGKVIAINETKMNYLLFEK